MAKYDQEAAKKAKKAKRAARKEVAKKKGKKATTSDLLRLEESSESEVPLDYLGSFFNHLIDTDFQQEDTATSHGKAEEVTIISSDSEPLPRQKIRRATRKVRFSHPLAYRDPQFLLKRQILESRRQTWTSKDADLSSSLPDATRRRRAEVISDLYSLYPLRVLLVNHSILLTQTISELHLPPMNQCSPACRLSKLLQGNDNLFILCLSYSCFLY